MSRFGRCEIGSLFRRCKKPGVATCQYCGLTFCADHGVFLDDHQEICLREICQAKRFDLEKHLIWKTEAANRNAISVCGIETCKAEPVAQCSKCHAVFCILHVREREETPRGGGPKLTKHVAVCEHCWERRLIWSKK
jgi:hypothetical protein